MVKFGGYVNCLSKETLHNSDFEAIMKSQKHAIIISEV